MNNLKMMLIQKHKKPSELAKYLGVSRSYISKMMMVDYKIPEKYDKKIGIFLNETGGVKEILQSEQMKDTRTVFEIIQGMTKNQKIEIISFILGTL